MNRACHKRAQCGYSLAETLIAAAIAAGILASATSALGGATRLSTRGGEQAQILGEAKIIAARLDAGMDEDDILSGLSGWRLERRPYRDLSGELHDTFDVVTAFYGDDDRFRFEFLARRRGESR